MTLHGVRMVEPVAQVAALRRCAVVLHARLRTVRSGPCLQAPVRTLRDRWRRLALRCRPACRAAPRRRAHYGRGGRPVPRVRAAVAVTVIAARPLTLARACRRGRPACALL